MKVVLSVIGKDKVGIIANVSNLLFEKNVNILDINQTIMNEFFTMVMPELKHNNIALVYQGLKVFLKNFFLNAPGQSHSSNVMIILER